MYSCDFKCKNLLSVYDYVYVSVCLYICVLPKPCGTACAMCQEEETAVYGTEWRRTQQQAERFEVMGMCVCMRVCVYACVLGMRMASQRGTY